MKPIAETRSTGFARTLRAANPDTTPVVTPLPIEGRRSPRCVNPTALATLVALVLAATPPAQVTREALEDRLAALEALDPSARDAAADALIAAGAAAVPLIDERLRDPSTGQRTLWYLWRLARELGAQAAPLRSTLEEFVTTDRVGQRRKAAEVLAGLDREGAAFVAARVVDLSMPSQELLNVLGTVASRGNPWASEQLVLLSAASDAQLASAVDSRLQSVGAAARSIGAARGWAALLARPAHTLRAAQALAAIGPEASPLAPAMLDALRESTNGALAAELARAIGSAGAVDPVRTALATATPRAKNALAWGLGFAGEPAVATLVELLADDDGEVRWRAIQALQRIGAGAVPRLVAALVDPVRTVAVIEALERIGPDAKRASRELRALAARDARLGPRIARALETIER